MRRLALVLWLAVSSLAHAALTAEQDQRYRALIAQLRCLVCQNQSIAESNAPLAADLRTQVETQIAAGRSDAEIKRYLTDRYGDFVLYQPPLKPATLLLWAGPAALLLGGLVAAVIFVRRSHRRRAAAPAPDRAALQRLLDEEP